MMDKQYYWVKNFKDYELYNEISDIDIMEIKKLNFFIGKNNSGKSKFLRKLFIEINIKDDYSSCQEFISSIQGNYTNFSIEINEIIEKSRNRKLYKNSPIFSSDSLVNEKEKSSYMEKLDELTKINTNCTEGRICFFNKLKKLPEFYQSSSIDIDSYELIIDSVLVDRVKNKYFNLSCANKFYIPVLRGMRPVGGNNFLYRKRTERDYFENNEHEKDVVTGESLYQELKEHLLGEPEQRELIAQYQRLLSQYFFENKEITLIPKHNDDVVYIKIGNEKQFPIYQLGDGLQQVIILTYSAFLNNQNKRGCPEKCATRK